MVFPELPHSIPNLPVLAVLVGLVLGLLSRLVWNIAAFFDDTGALVVAIARNELDSDGQVLFPSQLVRDVENGKKHAVMVLF